TAKVKELNAWAKVVNEGFPARKKPIKTSVPKPKLVEALAVFYQLDLSQTPVTAPAEHPITVSEHILERQWDDFVAIAEERDLAEQNGIPFLLMKNANFPDSLCIELRRLLHCYLAQVTGTPRSALVAKNGSLDSLSAIHALHEALYDSGSLTVQVDAHIPQIDSRICSNLTTQVDLMYVLNNNKSVEVLGGQTLLEACALDIKALETISSSNGLQDAIGQVESGFLQNFVNDQRVGAKNPEVWSQVRNSVSKRKRLYSVLINDFKGDKDHFFAFFTMPEKLSKSGKLLPAKPVAFRLAVEAISRCKKEVDVERSKSVYHIPDSEQFSLELWNTKWGQQNDWEIWRKLGKERYLS
ncbi:hypothetical protein BDP27DRAFT_1435167, partial [Rhodocollybia butyracea]